VLARGNWYPVRDIVPSNGLLHIKTLVTEIVIESFSQIAWLKRAEGAAAIEVEENPGARPEEAEQSRNFYSRRYGVRPRQTVVPASYPPTPELSADLTPRRRPAQPAHTFGNDQPALTSNCAAQETASRAARTDQANLASGEPEAKEQESESRSFSDPWSWDSRFKPDVEPDVEVSEHSAAPSTYEAEPDHDSPQPNLSPQSTHPAQSVEPVSSPRSHSTTRSARIQPISQHEPTLIEPTPLPSATKPVPKASEPEMQHSEKMRVGTALTDLSTVLRFSEGKVYVTTLLGELVIEGKDLKFWLNQPLETT